MARSKRRRGNRVRAFRYFILAALTVIIAGFIARREIPFLMSSGIDVASHRTSAAIAKRHGPVPDGENLHPSVTPAGADGNLAPLAPASANQPRDTPAKGSSTEEITRSERQQLGELIKERSR